MANSADPAQLASSTDLDLHCLQKQGISRFSRTRVKHLKGTECDVDIFQCFFTTQIECCFHFELDRKFYLMLLIFVPIVIYTDL